MMNSDGNDEKNVNECENKRGAVLTIGGEIYHLCMKEWI